MQQTNESVWNGSAHSRLVGGFFDLQLNLIAEITARAERRILQKKKKKKKKTKKNHLPPLKTNTSTETALLTEMGDLWLLEARSWAVLWPRAVRVPGTGEGQPSPQREEHKAGTRWAFSAVYFLIKAVHFLIKARVRRLLGL